MRNVSLDIHGSRCSASRIDAAQSKTSNRNGFNLHAPGINRPRFAMASALLILAACSAAWGQANSGRFAGESSQPGDYANNPSAKLAAVASVTLSPAYVVGGASINVIVQLAEPAPFGGVEVELKSSDPRVAAPASVTIPFGQSRGAVALSTPSVSAPATVAITALYGNTLAGSSLVVVPANDSATKSAFTVAAHPSTITVAPGKTGSAKVTTTVTKGYDHELDLSVSNVPAGVSIKLNPSTIPAPGAGTSKAKITVPVNAQPGTFSMNVNVSDGSTSQSAPLTLNVAASGPGATFQGCWYQKNGNQYQGVKVTVEDGGTYPFNAVLYYGASCNPNDWADEFGFGQLLPFTPGYTWTFWFTDFGNQTAMSAIWYVGTQQSKCVNYAVAPNC
jgi:hypothetical protein